MQKQLGKYELLKELGKGGMGVVYLARDVETGARVALKALAPELTRNPKYVERFRREAKAVSQLEHPNIIRILDIGEQEGTFYFAMEYLGGPTLRNLLEQRGRLSISEAASVIIQIADALDKAHVSGVIHRDVKPDNIMADEGGKFKIMDFGIAHTEEGTRLTVTGTIMGTPEYMSPEQASGGTVDRRADIYALGIVLYEMLTGKVPFRAQTAVEIIQMHITKMPESPKLINPDIPGNLANIIAKMIEKQPADRYDSFRHVINAISQTLPEQMRTVVGATMKEIQARPARKAAQPPAKTRERVVLQTPAVVRIALAASILLNLILFGYAILKRGHAEAVEPPPVFSLGGQVFAPPAVFGKTLLIAAEDGVVRAVNTESGSITWTFQTRDKVTAAPVVDRDLVYIGSWDKHLYALDAADGALRWKVPVGGCVFAAPALVDGILYVCTREGHVVALDGETGEPKWERSTGARVSFSPAVQEGIVFVASDEKNLIALRSADGASLGEVSTGRIKSPIVAKGKELFYAAFDEFSGRDELEALALEERSGGGPALVRHLRWKAPMGPASEPGK